MPTPLLINGILASGITGHLGGNYYSIATVTGNGSSNTLTFSSIPQTYTHLQLRLFTRDTRSASNNTIQVYFNGDAGNPITYIRHELRGDGSSITVSYVSSAGETTTPYIGASGSTLSNVYGAGVYDVLDYTNTNKNKVIRSFGGFDANGSGFSSFLSGMWLSTNAITSISITNNTNSAWTSNTVVALYGIK